MNAIAALFNSSENMWVDNGSGSHLVVEHELSVSKAASG